MFQTNIKLAFRNLYNLRFFATINILGLAIGMASFLMIIYYVGYELSYDKYHENSERIYRLVNVYNKNGVGEQSSSSPFPVAKALEKEYPHLIEKTVRFFNFQNPTNPVFYENIRYNERGFFFADPEVFQVFDFNLLEGNPDSALAKPNTVVISKSASVRYFGKENPMGKQITLLNGVALEITGIAEDVKPYSHFRFDFLASFSTLNRLVGPRMNTWIWNPAWTYILLQPGVEPDDLEAELDSFVDNYFFDAEKDALSLYLQKLTDIHLKSHLSYEIESNSDILYIYAFITIAVFILIIASINFINLTTASSSERFKEIAIKKVFGASRKRLSAQFITEAIIIAYTSLFISLGLVELMLPLFSDYIDVEPLRVLKFTTQLIIGVIILGLTVGFFSGSYPAFYLSGFQPAHILKGIIKKKPVNLYARSVLVTIQFTISILLMIATIVVFRQINYLSSADLGFHRKNILLIHTANTPTAINFEKFKNDLLEFEDVKQVTGMNDIIGVNHNIFAFRPEGTPKNDFMYMPGLIVRDDFIETFDIDIIKGRGFNKSNADDARRFVLINESMLEFLDWDMDSAVGRDFSSPYSNQKVLGIFRDFQATSLHNPKSPFVLFMNYRFQNQIFFTRYAAIRFNEGTNITQLLKNTTDVWNKHAPNNLMEYNLLDEEINHLYRTEIKVGKISMVFTMLALFIASLGIFGLSAFVTELRSKEIGIRKAIGASIFSIIKVLSRDFIRLIIIANSIAWPLAYVVMKLWLNQFSGSTPITIIPFIISGVLSFTIAIGIGSYRAWKAASSNPVDILKYE